MAMTCEDKEASLIDLRRKRGSICSQFTRFETKLNCMKAGRLNIDAIQLVHDFQHIKDYYGRYLRIERQLNRLGESSSYREFMLNKYMFFIEEVDEYFSKTSETQREEIRRALKYVNGLVTQYLDIADLSKASANKNAPSEYEPRVTEAISPVLVDKTGRLDQCKSIPLDSIAEVPEEVSDKPIERENAKTIECIVEEPAELEPMELDEAVDEDVYLQHENADEGVYLQHENADEDVYLQHETADAEESVVEDLTELNPMEVEKPVDEGSYSQLLEKLMELQKPVDEGSHPPLFEKLIELQKPVDEGSYPQLSKKLIEFEKPVDEGSYPQWSEKLIEFEKPVDEGSYPQLSEKLREFEKPVDEGLCSRLSEASVTSSGPKHDGAKDVAPSESTEQLPSYRLHRISPEPQRGQYATRQAPLISIFRLTGNSFTIDLSKPKPVVTCVNEYGELKRIRSHTLIKTPIARCIGQYTHPEPLATPLSPESSTRDCEPRDQNQDTITTPPNVLATEDCPSRQEPLAETTAQSCHCISKICQKRSATTSSPSTDVSLQDMSLPSNKRKRDDDDCDTRQIKKHKYLQL